MPFPRGLNLKARALEPELMDDPEIDWDQHREALEGLARLNSLSSAHGPIWEAIAEIVDRRKKLKILDIASGAGDLPLMLAQKAKQLGYDFEIHACDKSPQAIRYIRERANSKAVNIQSFVADIKQEKIPSGYDVLISSLFLHHLTSDETISFLENLKSAAPAKIIIDDLIRSRFGFLLAYAGSRLFSRSPVVHFDGPQSVKAAYTIPEVLDISGQAGFNHVHIRKVWPERFLMTWKN